MNLWELLTTSGEERRRRAREAFQAGLQQPEVFRMEDIPLSTLQQMAGQYEKGYGLPYPRQPAASPTAGVEGMTFDPNRQTTVQPPANMPLELVQPRSLEESALRQAGIQGRAAGEQRIGELQQYMESPQLGPDFLGEDADELDLPSTAGFQRYPLPDVDGQTGPQKQWGDIQYDKYGHAFARDPLTNEPKSLWGAPGGGGSGEQDKYAPYFDDAMALIKSYIAAVDVPDSIKMMAAFDRTGSFLNNPSVIAMVSQQLPKEYKQAFNQAVQQVLWIMQQRSKEMPGMPQQTMDQQEAATAESFLKKHIGQ